MKIILLDRNAVISIKRKIAGKKIPSERDRSLRLLDKRSNLISPILSIREGQSGIRENKQELQQTLLKETEAISRFFKNARTDSNILIEKIEEFSDIFSNNIEIKWKCYISFINEMQNILYQPISKKEKDDYREKIINFASDLDIPHTHPAVLCSLSVLYGCRRTRQILKPKKNRSEEQKNKDAYNTMNDLIIISRLHLIKAVSDEKRKSTDQIKYFTFDKGLEFFLKCITTKKVESICGSQNTATIGEISCNRKLFPELDEESFVKLMESLQRHG